MPPQFRFGNPGAKAGAWKKKINFLYYFCAWNAFGLVIYDFYRKKIAKTSTLNEKWDSMNHTQKYLHLVDIHGSEGVIYKKYKGFEKVEERKTTVEEMKAGNFKDSNSENVENV